MTPEILEQCDPGIRSVVEWLWSHGFETSDSGDGVTKLKEGSEYDPDDIIRVPHVVLKVEQGLSILIYINAAETLDMLVARIEGDCRIEVTRSYPDHTTTVILFPSVEWIANLSDVVHP